MNRFILGSLLSFLVSLTPMFAEEKSSGIPADYKLLYSQDFSKPESLKDFVMTDANAWKWSNDDKPALELVKQSKYAPPYRSPLNIALIGGQTFRDFVVEVDCLQTGKEYGHRDMIYVFGFQNPAQYYYTHISTKEDAHANNIFIVKDAPRLKISKVTNSGNDWGLNKWHKVRLERKVAEGSVKVYFDDMSKPIMVAEDQSFGAGWIGFGSFDDTGKIANIKVWGPNSEAKAAPAFGSGK